MAFVPLQSSMMAGFDYDPDARVLKLRWSKGGETAYRDVPKDVAEGLEQADSAGRYFHQSIKGKFGAW